MLTQETSLPQAPQVWDKPTPSAKIGDYIRTPFTPVMRVMERDVLESGQVWLLLKPTTGSYTESWVVEPVAQVETLQQPEPQPQEEPVGFAGDSIACQLQPTQSALTEFEAGRCHGRADAEARQHPIYIRPFCEYAIGYLDGYKSYSTQQQPAPSQPVEWSVTYDPQWRWYQAWVKDRCIGNASTPEQAERIAQKYIATNEMIRRQNAAVLKAYSGF